MLQSIDASGSEVTISDDLPTGLVFWRLTTRAASGLGRRTSPTWVLYVEPAEGCSRTSFEVRAGDYDGDGVADTARASGRDLIVGFSSGLTESTLTLRPDGCEPISGTPFMYCHYDAYVAGVGIGDIDGDGVGDLARLSNFTYRAGSDYRNGQRWRSTLGGLGGLGGEGWGGGDHWHDRGDRVTIQVEGAGDIDGDGYGDVYEILSATLLRGEQRRFLTRADGPWNLSVSCFNPTIARADFNGDHILDVATRYCDDESLRTLPGSDYAMGRPPPNGLEPARRIPGCGSLGIAEGAAILDVVEDIDCDGFDDLIARGLYARDVRYALLGGRDGLSSARCRALPGPP